MVWSILADALMLLHAGFVAWVAAGAFAVWRWPWLAWLHLPALAWGVWIEASGGVCPLTPLEVAWRRAAGEQGYAGGFVEHYLGALLYPQELTRAVQGWLAFALAAFNALVYVAMLRRRMRRRRIG